MKKFGMIFSLVMGIPCLLCSQEIDQIAEKNVYCKWQGKNASASVDKGFVAKGSYLYWLANEEGLEFTQLVNVRATFPEPIVAHVDLLEPSSKWNSGFQVGLGYIFPQRSQWDVLLNWTWFHSHANKSILANDPTLTQQMLRPTWLPFLMGSEAFDATGRWTLKYDTLDLLLGRDLFLGKWLSIHPQAGIRGVHLHQNYRATYHGADNDGMGGLIPVGETFFHAKWTYNGIGTRLGTDVEWHINSYFSVVANGFLSLLYGRYHVQELFSGAFPVVPGTILGESIYINRRYYRLRTALESELGIRLQKFFSNDTRRVVFGAYYGFSYWMRQNQMFNQFLELDATGNSLITNLPTSGDLQLQGLRIELGVDF